MSSGRIQRPGQTTASLVCVAAGSEPIAAGIAAKDATAALNHAAVGIGLKNDRVRSPSASSPRTAAPIAARQAGARYPDPPSVATVSVESGEADIETRKAMEAPRPAPLDGNLIRHRWRSLIGRHPPKTLSHVLMDRILAWREQVAEAGDISPRSRTILAAALAGKAAAAEKDGHVQDSENKRDHGAHRHRPDAPVRVGTALMREHAGVLHRVTVVAEGFEWDGRIYASVSAVARAITGVRWNGRRFFALDRSARQAVARKTSEQESDARRVLREPNEPYRAGGGR